MIVTGKSDVDHVTFLWGWTPGKKGSDDKYTPIKNVQTLGGNQGNRVKISSEGRKLFTARGQNGVTSPYLWPLRGESGCTIASVPTDQPHYCGKNPV